ncbi:hypothetical protein [Aurantivibrio plasticivorans]
MDDLTKARNLSPAEIDELRAEVKVASAALDEARRKLISSKIKDTVAKDKQPPSVC